MQEIIDILRKVTAEVKEDNDMDRFDYQQQEDQKELEYRIVLALDALSDRKETEDDLKVINYWLGFDYKPLRQQ